MHSNLGFIRLYISFMKYSLIAIFIIVSSFSAFAQIDDSNSITANINVSAEVIQSIELITVNTMQFGNAQPGQREIYVNPVNSLNAGYMIAVGTPDA
ncbi:MAG TPA: hypothetical protein DEG32_01735, partial [Balneolaceae bacterium]|nr:hypothetical protein [Balneolaceae bacterium]